MSMTQLKTKTITLKDDLWLFAKGNSQTHSVIPKGSKVKLHYNLRFGFGSVYDSKYGQQLSATFNRSDLELYGLKEG